MDADQNLLEEISKLERRLHQAQSRLHGSQSKHAADIYSQPVLGNSPCGPEPTSRHSALHTLLLLSDSALPLGSFAFSSGLESYLAHHRRSHSTGASGTPPNAFHTFLQLSLTSVATTSLPYVLAAHREPAILDTLDNDLDASTPCTVARRASVAQGRALLAVWDRSYRPHFAHDSTAALADRAMTNNTTLSNLTEPTSTAVDAARALSAFHSRLRSSSSNTGSTEIGPNAHLAPIWGATTCALGLPAHGAAYLFLFSHARTIISAGVRASVLGPYQAQALLASPELRTRLAELSEEARTIKAEEAFQSVPVMDLWIGRHELLYSRIFNS